MGIPAQPKPTIEETVITLVSRQMGTPPDRILLETDLIADLGADSLDHVELIMEFEDEFDVNISEEEGDKVTKISDIVALVKSKI
jgi:acyl carrier protein